MRAAIYIVIVFNVLGILVGANQIGKPRKPSTFPIFCIAAGLCSAEIFVLWSCLAVLP